MCAIEKQRTYQQKQQREEEDETTEERRAKWTRKCERKEDLSSGFACCLSLGCHRSLQLDRQSYVLAVIITDISSVISRHVSTNYDIIIISPGRISQLLFIIIIVIREI